MREIAEALRNTTEDGADPELIYRAADEIDRLVDAVGDLGRLLAWAGVIDAMALDDAEAFDGGDTRRRIAVVKDRILTPNAGIHRAAEGRPVE